MGNATRTRPLLDVARIYHEPNVEEYARGREILARFPNAERVEVPSHWNIPGLHGNEGLVRDWVKTKRERSSSWASKSRCGAARTAAARTL